MKKDMKKMALGVGLSTVATMAIGMVWYGPLFGAQWLALSGVNPEAGDATTAMLGALVCAVLKSATLYCFAYRLKIKSLVSGIMLGATIWTGFVLTTSISGVLFENYDSTLFVLHAGYDLATYVAIGAITALFV